MGGGRYVNRWHVIIKAFIGGLMPKFIDRTGQKFGRLLVLEDAGRDRLKKVLWKCQCDCSGWRRDSNRSNREASTAEHFAVQKIQQLIGHSDSFIERVFTKFKK